MTKILQREKKNKILEETIEKCLDNSKAELAINGKCERNEIQNVKKVKVADIGITILSIYKNKKISRK